MSYIYRLRPSNTLTLDEITNNYLWFSRPTEFKDVDDSNVMSFMEINETLGDALNRIFGHFMDVAKEVSKNGICCFTETLPSIEDWSKFPKGHNGIFIEYRKDILEDFFARHFGIGDCFKKVDYLLNPLYFKSSSNYDVLWKTNEDGELYISLKEFERNDRLRDELFLRMFTRINYKYQDQKELRIILGGRNIPDKSEGLSGYKIPIPKEAINMIYAHPKTPDTVISHLSYNYTERLTIAK